MWVVEGLEDGRVAVVTKMHHSTMDGVTGADLMAHLFDLTPEPRDVEPPTAAFTGEEPPSPVVRGWWPPQPGGDTAADRTSGGQVHRRRRRGRQVVAAATPEGDPAADRPEGAVERGVVQRALGGPDHDLARDVKIVKDHHGVKVNDVLLAVTTQALRAISSIGNCSPTSPSSVGPDLGADRGR